MIWHNPREISPAQQFLFLRANPLCAGSGKLNAQGLTWIYKVRPTPLSREYTLRITFQRHGVPQVFVDSPRLETLAPGRVLPHVYHDPLRLCLYLPGSGEWTGAMRIDQTFVPWAATWLFYFEEWLHSDLWKGGGEHPRPLDDETRPMRRRQR